MSFEGYYQRMCKNGHYWEENVYNPPDKCPSCHGKVVWENIVDQTNGSYDEDGNRIDGYIEVETKNTKTCEHCGSVLEATYKVPKKRKKK